MNIFFIIILSLVIGSIAAIHGSGYPKTVSKGLNFTVKWLIMPTLLFLSAYFISNEWYIALLFVFPYAWKMATGTGGEQQAIRNQVCDIRNCVEWTPFDGLSTRMAKKLVRYVKWSYCERWGFSFALLSALVFMIPFMFTNPLYSLPLLCYPFLNRYLIHREVEFFWMVIYSVLFLLSCL